MCSRRGIIDGNRGEKRARRLLPDIIWIEWASRLWAKDLGLVRAHVDVLQLLLEMAASSCSQSAMVLKESRINNGLEKEASYARNIVQIISIRQPGSPVGRSHSSYPVGVVLCRWVPEAIRVLPHQAPTDCSTLGDEGSKNIVES